MRINIHEMYCMIFQTRQKLKFNRIISKRKGKPNEGMENHVEEKIAKRRKQDADLKKGTVALKRR